jgi:signal transduction histidine kinase/CheY-like chemotaxis protein
MSDLSTDFVGMALPDGQAIYVNPAGRSLCGIGLEEDVSRLRFTDFHPPALEPHLLEALAHATVHGTWRGATELMARNGSTLSGSQLIICHRERTGRVARFSTVIRDQREVIELQQRLSQAERLEAIGRLAGGVAHDFNNLLTVIENCAAMAQEELPKESQGHQDVAMILQASERATALCRQLLSFARRQIIHPEPTRLNAVINGISGLLRRMIGEHIQLELELDAEASYVRVDPSQIDQVLANLAVNARDAMPDGGVLIISTTNVTLDEPRTTNEGSVPAGEYVELSISDTGEGMTPEVKSRIFEPFFTSRGSHGSGLGLATVYGAISQNQGHITVETTVGEGTQFRILLPRIAPPKGGQRTTPAPEALQGTESILLVEDEDMVRHVAYHILTRAGYDVTEVSSSAVALTLASERKVPFDLIVTDVVMPDMNGPTLIEHLRELWGPLRALFASGYTQNALDVGGVIPDGVSFVTKPFSEQQLLESVRRTLGRPPT